MRDPLAGLGVDGALALLAVSVTSSRRRTSKSERASPDPSVPQFIESADGRVYRVVRGTRYRATDEEIATLRARKSGDGS